MKHMRLPTGNETQFSLFHSLPLDVHKRILIESWTRKEALAKALGGGLAIALETIPIECASGPTWFVANIEMGGRYAAASAANVPRADLQLWNLSNTDENARINRTGRFG
jgi:hypothetical protein